MLSLMYPDQSSISKSPYVLHVLPNPSSLICSIAITVLDEGIMYAAVIEFGTLRHFDGTSCCEATGSSAWASIRHPTSFVLQPLFLSCSVVGLKCTAAGVTSCYTDPEDKGEVAHSTLSPK